MDSFTRAYIEAALWSSTDDAGEPLDRDHDLSDIAPETLETMVSDCAEFQASCADLLASAYALYRPNDEWSPEAQAGHDYWLTRNGHGAGFWDRGLGDVGDQLTDKAHAYGESDLYIGDDGLIYC